MLLAGSAARGGAPLLTGYSLGVYVGLRTRYSCNLTMERQLDTMSLLNVNCGRAALTTIGRSIAWILPRTLSRDTLVLDQQ